jgi:hypothetical protein
VSASGHDTVLVPADAATPTGFLVMEVELHEPGLFFPLAPRAAEAFAEAIIRRF